MALGICAEFAAGADSGKGTMQLKKDIERVMEKHILAQGQLTGTYKRK